MLVRFLAGALVALVVVAQSHAASAQSLEKALILAYTTNPTLLAARDQLRATDEQIAQALSGWRPTLKASGSSGYEHYESNATGGRGFYPSSLSLSVSQPIYSGGGVVASVAQANAVIDAQRASLVSTEQTVLLDAVTAYMDVVQARAVLDLAKNNESRLERQLQATQDRFKVGEVTRTDVAQAQASLAQARADRVLAEGNVTNADAVFKKTIGVVPTTLSNPGQLIAIPKKLDTAIALANADHPALLSAIATEKAAAAGIDVKRASLLPAVSVTGTLTHDNNSSYYVSHQNIAQITADVTIPLYLAGQAASQVREAKQTDSQRLMQIDETRRQVLAQLVDGWQKLDTARAQIAAYTEQVKANQIALDGTQREAEVGERTVLDVLDAEQALFQSQISLVKAQRDAVVQSYTVQSDTGHLTAKDLKLPVPYYSDLEHYKKTRDNWGFGGLLE